MVALIIVIQKNASNNQYISFLKGNVENDIEDQNIPSVNENLIEGEQITYDTTQEVKSVIPEENYTILSIVNTYYSTINKAYYNNQNSEGKQKIIDKLYNMLSRNYINSKNIGKTIILLFLIIILILGGLMWFDYLGIILAKTFFSPIYITSIVPFSILPNFLCFRFNSLHNIIIVHHCIIFAQV